MVGVAGVVNAGVLVAGVQVTLQERTGSSAIDQAGSLPSLQCTMSHSQGCIHHFSTENPYRVLVAGVQVASVLVAGVAVTVVGGPLVEISVVGIALVEVSVVGAGIVEVAQVHIALVEGTSVANAAWHQIMLVAVPGCSMLLFI